MKRKNHLKTSDPEQSNIKKIRYRFLKRAFIFPLAFILFFPTGYESLLAQEAGTFDPDRVMAMINDTPITVEMLNQAMEERLPATGHRSLSERRFLEIQKEEMEKLVLQILMVQGAKKRGIQVESDEIDTELEKLRARFSSESAFQRVLTRRGLSLKMMRQGIERHLYMQKVRGDITVGIAPSENDLKKYYDENPRMFQMPEQIRIRLILIAVDPSSRSGGWEEARNQADSIIERAKGGEDFASLVAEFSDDERTKSNGGDTGLIHQGRLPFHELEEVVFSKTVGEIGEPVRTLYGDLVYKIEEKKPPHQLKYSQINKKLLMRELKESQSKKRVNEWLGSLRAQAEITTY